MTSVAEQKSDTPSGGKRRWSTLQKRLVLVVVGWAAIIPIFWYLEFHAGVSHKVASNAMTIVGVLLFATALTLPWLNLRGMEARSRAEKFDGMIIVWIFIALAPRFIWELPWLLFLDEIKQGVIDGKLWTYFWSPYLSGGDARYLNGDPLVLTLEWVALFVGIFELYAIVMFFRQGKRFTLTQLSFIMGGMIVEVMLPAVYFLTDILGKTDSSASAADLWIKFVLLNSFWCTMPFLTYFWGVRRLSRQDLEVPSF